MAAIERTGTRRKKVLVRLAGLALLVLLVWQANLSAVWNTWQSAEWSLLILAFVISLPMLYLKTIRWWSIMRGQKINYGLWDAYLAAWAGILIGALTPGRLGEFTRALYVSWETGVESSHAVASVLVDRIFDMLALAVVGSIAFASLVESPLPIVIAGGSAAIFLIVLSMWQNFPASFLPRLPGMQRLSSIDWPGKHWVLEIWQSLITIPGQVVLLAVLLTSAAYGVYFGQCFLIARAIDLDIGLTTVSYAVALGSLVALLPISIAGLGTREAAIIAYLGTKDISSENALSFSLLVFVVFYIGGGFLGMIAWWIKPLHGGMRHIRESVSRK